MSDIAIKVENLSKKYLLGTAASGNLRDTLANGWGRLTGREKKTERKEFWALKDVSFEVKKGEVIGVIGRNGAGKSTLLKILSRITEPTSGRVELNGRVASLLEVGTGFHPELSGRENIFLNGALLGMTRAEIKRKFDEIIDFSGVEEFIDTPVKKYSSGMYVRLAFAVAAHLEPEILLVDEVLAVGDAEFQKKCLGKMDEVAKGGRTVVFVSHNMGAVKQLCEKIIFLNQGKIHYFSNNLDIPINAYLNFGLTQGEEIISKFINRKGNGKLLFKGITFQNDKNLNIEYISIGETLKIVLQYKIQSSLVIRKLSVRIEVANKAGTILFVCNSNHSNCEYLNLSGNGKVICSIPQLPLNKGMYFLSISGRQYGEVLDSVDLVAPLIVESNDFFGTGRLPSSEIPILLKNNWN